ncbi:MAG: phosphatidate cytidylyltransferase [Brevinematia bacterium]
MFSKELKERVLISSVLAPIILFVALPWFDSPLYFGSVYFFFIILALAIFFEIVKMFEKKYFYIPKFKKTTFVIFVTISIIVFSSISITDKFPLQNLALGEEPTVRDFGSIAMIILSLFLSLLILNLSLSALNISKNNYLISDSILSVSSTYIVLSVGSMLTLKLIDISNKTFFLAFTLGVGWFSEAGALVIGKTLGRIKLLFLASPNKTLEGTIGMLVLGIIGGILFKFILDSVGYQSFIFIPSYTDAIILALVVVFLSFFGDIIESLMKRFFDTKDSGHIFLSLGGVFDVFDGVMLASFGVMLYYLVF